MKKLTPLELYTIAIKNQMIIKAYIKLLSKFKNKEVEALHNELDKS